jgi:thymidylate synthase ThyX
MQDKWSGIDQESTRNPPGMNLVKYITENERHAHYLNLLVCLFRIPQISIFIEKMTKRFRKAGV